MGRPLGIALTVLGAATGAWVLARLVSQAGRMYTWQPPFAEYEIATLVGGGIATVLLIVGLIAVTRGDRGN